MEHYFFFFLYVSGCRYNGCSQEDGGGCIGLPQRFPTFWSCKFPHSPSIYCVMTDVRHFYLFLFNPVCQSTLHSLCWFSFGLDSLSRAANLNPSMNFAAASVALTGIILGKSLTLFTFRNVTLIQHPLQSLCFMLTNRNHVHLVQ